jgi:hypothetical protein
MEGAHSQDAQMGLDQRGEAFQKSQLALFSRNKNDQLQVSQEYGGADENEPVHTETTANDEEEEQEHPLFMTGLPSSFANNSGLAAIASMLGDDDAGEQAVREEQACLTQGQKGGGKVNKKHSSSRIGRRSTGLSSPYANNKTKTKSAKKKKAAQSETKSSSTNVSEAQLFLNMWKI